MPTCPDCGSTLSEGPDASRPDCEARIAAWLDAPGEAAGPRPAPPESACTACGYAGDMAVDAGRGVVSCPACGVAAPPRAAPIVRVVECPCCGLGIGLTEADAGRTVVCPACAYFLGAVTARRGAG